ncbi:YbaY family lipoprotein [Craterilacuibacter sp.]|uniref:YbaY family lipoprotein n=1 Tax=Craterilacuibacter sp. TaxID=2870909 RepID=UPI003F3EF68E
MIAIKPLLPALAIAILTGCASTPSYQPAQLEGRVAYKIRIALPPAKTRVDVRLLDISREDAPSVVLAEQILEQPKGFPLPFSLRYDQAAIQSMGRYALDARIYLDGQLFMSSRQQVPTLQQGNNSATEVWVDPVGN